MRSTTKAKSKRYTYRGQTVEYKTIGENLVRSTPQGQPSTENLERMRQALENVPGVKWAEVSGSGAIQVALELRKRGTNFAEFTRKATKAMVKATERSVVTRPGSLSRSSSQSKRKDFVNHTGKTGVALA